MRTKNRQGRRTKTHEKVGTRIRKEGVQDGVWEGGCSSIQDIGWQIAFRWRGECHLLCISPNPALSEQHSTFIAHICKGDIGWVRNLNKNIFRLCAIHLISCQCSYCKCWSISDGLMLKSYFIPLFPFSNRYKVPMLSLNLSGWWSPVSPGICKDEINESKVLTGAPLVPHFHKQDHPDLCKNAHNNSSTNNNVRKVILTSCIQSNERRMWMKKLIC